MRRAKRWLSVFLAVVIMAGSMINVYAEDTDTVPESGPEAEMKANSWRYQDGVPIQPEDNSSSTERDGGRAYHPNATKTGIDVSEWQGVIDWEQVKASGIDFAIIRCGWGMNYSNQDDSYFERNVSECERLGIPYGVYLYSYATDTAHAQSEAKHVLRLIEGHNLSYPVFFDMEDNTTIGCDLAAIAQTFCNAIENAGYAVGVYANLNWWNNYLTDPCFDNWYRWVAQYNSECNYDGAYTLWQYTSEGYVPGIDGYTDMNFLIGSPADHGQSSYDGPYTDITGSEWFLSAVDFVTEAGVMDGLTEDTFGGFQNLTRGQLVTSLWKIDGEPVPSINSGFQDVPSGQSYTEAVLWAYQNGIVGGYSNGCFGPEDNVTREQMAAIICAYVEYKGGLTSKMADISSYPDAARVSDFAQDAMRWIVGTGLIQGKSDGLLDPQGNITRAECAVILERYMEPFSDVKYSMWCAENICLVNLSSLMTGTSENIFSPSDSLARAQFATIMYRMENSPEVSFSDIFSDVMPDSWFADSVIWASQAGLVTGYGDTGLFGPGDYINREQLAVVLYRYAQMKGYDVSQKNSLSGYPDGSSVNAFAKEAMEWCTAAGIITGDNGYLKPQGNANRAECATIIMRFLQRY